MRKLSFNQNWLFNGKTITLPHDAQISEKRGPKTSNGGHGYFPGGVYTYEKTFLAPSDWAGKECFHQPERPGALLPSLRLHGLLCASH